MSAPIAPDDIVQTAADAEGNSRPPLLVVEPLLAFLDEHGLGAGDIPATPIGEGHSNVTYLIERGGSEFVLRRPPRPPLPPSAHDVLREARLLQRAAGHPRAGAARCSPSCDEEAVIGSPFYVMERVEGEVIVETIPRALDTPGERRLIGEQLIDALVEIHAVDWRAAGLEDFGKPTGYLERQLRRFGGLWELNKTREIPAVESVGSLAGREHARVRPGDDRPRRLPPRQHDLRRRTRPRSLLAVLDWEMATIGDPLADLGYLCMMWTEAGRPDRRAARAPRQGHARGGLPHPRGADRPLRRAAPGARWATSAGTPTLALWKSIVFMEGNYKRAIAGTTDDPYLKQFGEGVLELAARRRRWRLAPERPTRPSSGRTALLIDWGGVLTTSSSDEN